MSDEQDYKTTAREAHESAHEGLRVHLRELRTRLAQAQEALAAALEHLDAIVDEVQVNTIADTLLERSDDE